MGSSFSGPSMNMIHFVIITNHHPQPIARPAVPVETVANGGASAKTGNVANAANVAYTGNVADNAGVSPTEHVKSRSINCIDTYDFLIEARFKITKPTMKYFYSIVWPICSQTSLC